MGNCATAHAKGSHNALLMVHTAPLSRSIRVNGEAKAATSENIKAPILDLFGDSFGYFFGDSFGDSFGVHTGPLDYQGPS